MVYKHLGYILFFLLLFIAVIQVVFFYNTYHLRAQQINTQLQLNLTKIEQAIERHEINRHKQLFNEYRNQYLCPPEKDTFIDITFRIYHTDTFNNLHELSEVIHKKLSKQAISSGQYMLEQLPIDTAYIDSIIHQLINTIDKNLNVSYTLQPLNQTSTATADWEIELFDDYRFYAPLHLSLTILGLKKLLFQQLFLTLFSCVVILILAFLVTRYTYLTLIKYRQLADSKTEFIGHLAHEIKTPLTSIYVASQALKDERITKDVHTLHKYAHAIYHESERLQRQLENVLNVAAAERQFLTMNKTPTDLNKLVVNITQLFHQRIQDADGRLHLQFNNTQQIVSIDPNHMGNVIYNLMDNAIKYSRPKPLQIDVEITQEPQYLILKIADKGIGIATSNQQKVFDAFYKAHNNISGFGVGLHYVKLIIEAHNGLIKLTSKPNAGTTIIISLPY